MVSVHWIQITYQPFPAQLGADKIPDRDPVRAGMSYPKG